VLTVESLDDSLTETGQANNLPNRHPTPSQLNSNLMLLFDRKCLKRAGSLCAAQLI
jgi:hypothetical protein